MFVWIALQLFLTSLYGATPEECRELLEAYKLEKKYETTYNIEAKLKKFWKYHKRFGLVSWNNQHLLIAKTKEQHNKLQQDLIEWKSTFLEKTPRPIKPEWDKKINAYAADVSTLLPNIAKKTLIKASFDVNCFGFSCKMAGLIDEFYGISDEQMHFWLNSPLAKKISNNSQIEPGSIIAYRIRAKTDSEIHSAIYISEDLVFSKNGFGEENFYIQDFTEMNSIYKKENVTLDFYKIMPVADYAIRHKNQISPLLWKTLYEIAELEKQIAPSLMGTFDKQPLVAIDKEKVYKDYLKVFNLYEKVKIKAEITSTQTPEDTLWKSLELRTKDLMSRLGENL